MTDRMELNAPDDDGVSVKEAELLYQLSEVCGTVEEYLDRPCVSLRGRMRAAKDRAMAVMEKMNND